MADFTTEELLALATGLNIRDPVFLQVDPIASWSDDVRREVDHIGIRSLEVRDLIRTIDGGLHVPESLGSLLEVASHPDFVVQASRTQETGTDMASFYGGEDLVVGHRLNRVGNHSLTRFATEDLPGVLFAMTRLHASPVALGEPIPLPAAFLERVATEALETSSFDHMQAEALLDAGVDGPIAERFEQLLGSLQSISTVLSLQPADEGLALGASTTWLDTANEALWLVEDDLPESAEEPATVTIRPATGSEIQGSILAGLPDRFSELIDR
jgi:hypothetical protein